MFDNGLPYLFVGPGCQYWTTNPSQIWSETRTGIIDPAASVMWGERLHFGAWTSLSGEWTDVGVYDAPVYEFAHADDHVLCTRLCGAASVPTAVKEMRDAAVEVSQELWNAGHAVTTGVRLAAVRVDRATAVPYVEWPISRAISDFVQTAPVDYGEGVLEVEPDRVTALRELRSAFLRGDYGSFIWNSLPVRSGDEYFNVYMRDALPFEGADGLVLPSAGGR